MCLTIMYILEYVMFYSEMLKLITVFFVEFSFMILYESYSKMAWMSAVFKLISYYVVKSLTLK